MFLTYLSLYNSIFSDSSAPKRRSESGSTRRTADGWLRRPGAGSPGARNGGFNFEKLKVMEFQFFFQF